MPARVTASHILLVGNHRAQDIAFTTQCVARNRNGRYAIWVSFRERSIKLRYSIEKIGFACM
jgi:hypothetical protein